MSDQDTVVFSGKVYDAAHASVVWGSSKAVWNVNLGPSFCLSKTLKTKHSSLVIEG